MTATGGGTAWEVATKAGKTINEGQVGATLMTGVDGMGCMAPLHNT